VDLDRVDRITAGAVGDPGRRTFCLQARREHELVTVVVEKQQVELLSTSILEILAGVDEETGKGPGEEDLELEEPLEPLWHAGRLSIGYDEDRDLIFLQIEELVPEDEEEPEEERSEPERVRLWATREQMLALSRHAAAVVARGRPLCQFCSNPMDPEGHTCPAMNGHGRP
jgi:uncharacterized repeat protein (TIGR03847 family)